MQANQNLTDFECEESDHLGQKLTYLCYDEDCSNKGMICSLCAFEKHKSHACEPLKFTLRQIQMDETKIFENIQLLAKIDQSKLKIIEQANKIDEVNFKNILNMAIDMYLQNISNKCFSNFKQQLTSDKQKMNKVLILYKKTFSQYENSEDKSTSNQQKLLKSFVQQLSQKQEVIKTAIKMGKFDNNLLAEFSLSQSYSSKKFYFNEKSMNSKLTFESETKIKMTGYVDDWNYLALCEPALSGLKTQQCSFKMTNLSCYVTLGISIKSKVQGSYQIITDETGHGCYHMSYDGYSWSDLHSEHNSKYTSWSFNQGDTVTVEVNPKQKKVKFIKNGDSENGYSFPYQVDKKQKVHFSVSFNSEPQQVDIVN